MPIVSIAYSHSLAIAINATPRRALLPSMNASIVTSILGSGSKITTSVATSRVMVKIDSAFILFSFSFLDLILVYATDIY